MNKSFSAFINQLIKATLKKKMFWSASNDYYMQKATVRQYFSKVNSDAFKAVIN